MPAAADTKQNAVAVLKRQGPATQQRLGPCPRDTKKHKFGNDTLGKLIDSSVALLSASSSWQQYVSSVRGPSHISSSVDHLPHPAAPLLVRLRTHGMPVVLRTSDWPAPLVLDRLARGSHKSADDQLTFVRDEMADFVCKGFWTVLPYEMVKHLRSL